MLKNARSDRVGAYAATEVLRHFICVGDKDAIQLIAQQLSHELRDIRKIAANALVVALNFNKTQTDANGLAEAPDSVPSLIPSPPAIATPDSSSSSSLQATKLSAQYSRLFLPVTSATAKQGKHETKEASDVQQPQASTTSNAPRRLAAT